MYLAKNPDAALAARNRAASADATTPRCCHAVRKIEALVAKDVALVLKRLESLKRQLQE